MNSDVEAVYRDNAIVRLGHYPALLPDGSEVPTMRLDSRSKVQNSFLMAVYRGALEVCPYLVHDYKYCLKDLRDPESWASMDNNQRRLAGRCFAWLVRNDYLPFELAPRRLNQTGTFFYYYIGTQTCQGGD